MTALPETINGIPLHPLLVHVIVVLLPLSCAGAVIMAFSRRFSRRFGPLVVAVAVLGILGSFAAKFSGEDLARSIRTPAEHADFGSTLPWLVLLYAALLLAFWLFDRGIPMNRPRPWWVITLGVLTLMSALVAMYWTVRTGNSGAQLAWSLVSR